jgi:hypothetical protein
MLLTLEGMTSKKEAAEEDQRGKQRQYWRGSETGKACRHRSYRNR